MPHIGTGSLSIAEDSRIDGWVSCPWWWSLQIAPLQLCPSHHLLSLPLLFILYGCIILCKSVVDANRLAHNSHTPLLSRVPIKPLGLCHTFEGGLWAHGIAASTQCAQRCIEQTNKSVSHRSILWRLSATTMCSRVLPAVRQWDGWQTASYARPNEHPPFTLNARLWSVLVIQMQQIVLWTKRLISGIRRA